MNKRFYENGNDKNAIHTFLWKVTGKNADHPIYLLGTCHTVGLSWLNDQPVVANIIKDATHLITESFTSPQSSTPAHQDKSAIKAVNLLDKNEYALLDSFFKAKSGATEGLDNDEAKEATVMEMATGIVEMLLRKDAKGTFEQMDLELFKSFQAENKRTSALESANTLDFKYVDTAGARQVLKKYINLVRIKNEFDLEDSSSEVNKIITWYKNKRYDYMLDEDQPENAVQNRSVLSVPERNKIWLPKLTYMITHDKENLLVAVGIFHLFYKTGLISLLRKEGYRVEPVLLK